VTDESAERGPAFGDLVSGELIEPKQTLTNESRPISGLYLEANLEAGVPQRSYVSGFTAE
jgi:hypothetical protein